MMKLLEDKDRKEEVMGMTREEKLELLNRLLEIEENNDIGNLTRTERGEFQQWVKALEQEPCEDAVSRQALIERINNAEENFKADHMESIASDDGDAFVDGVLSGVFNIREMVAQAPSVTPTTCIAKVTFDKDELKKIVDEKVKDLTITQEWIPISERLPKNSGFYLVSTTDCVTIMEFVNGWISQNIGSCNWYVKAWMPLPEPYKAESEDI